MPGFLPLARCDLIPSNPGTTSGRKLAAHRLIMCRASKGTGYLLRRARTPRSRPQLTPQSVPPSTATFADCEFRVSSIRQQVALPEREGPIRTLFPGTMHPLVTTMLRRQVPTTHQRLAGKGAQTTYLPCSPRAISQDPRPNQARRMGSDPDHAAVLLFLKGSARKACKKC